jgi:hypothetical protein
LADPNPSAFGDGHELFSIRRKRRARPDQAWDIAGAPQVYTSTNSGLYWNRTNVPDRSDWYWCASSADGTKLAALGASAFTDSAFSHESKGLI